MCCWALQVWQNGGRLLSWLEKDLGVHDFRAVLSLRDYPEWIYARYLFWCNADKEEDCYPGQWRDPVKHARSAEHFEQVVAAGVEGSELVHNPTVWPMPYQSYKAIVENLEAVAGRDRVLLVSQHDLFHRPAHTLRSIEAFVGIPRHDYAQEVLQGVFNHNEHRGIHSITHELRPGEYPDEGPMLAFTRATLESQFMEDCIWLLQSRGVCMPTCCDPATAEGSGAQAHSSLAAVRSQAAVPEAHQVQGNAGDALHQARHRH